MLDPTKISKLVQNVINNLPEGIQNMPNDVRENMKVGLQSALTKMDLVTREEFDVQTKVLARTRQKLEQLETRLQTILKNN